MFQVIASLLVLISGIALADDSDASKGILFLEQGKYYDAKEAFKNELIDLEAGTTFLNLAYSELKLGEKTPAYLHLIKAKELLPRNSTVKYYLSEIERDIELKYFEEKTFLGKVFIVGDYFNEYEMWLLGSSFFLFSSLFCLGFVLLRKRSLVPLYSFFLSFYFVGAGLHKSLWHSEWVISKKDTALQVIPSQSSEKLTNITKVSALKVIRESSGWAYVEVSVGKKGWINEADFLRYEN